MGPTHALIVVDVQNDFTPGGKLPIAEGDRVVPVLNGWIGKAREAGATVVASRDWHPSNHMSFKEQGGAWPPHCIRFTEGAAFHPDLELPNDAPIVTKGDNPEFDQYSAFDRTGLAELLKSKNVDTVWIGGLALDVCVRATVLDAVAEGFRVRLIRSATRAVNPDDGRRVIEELRDAGAEIEE